MCGGGKGQGSRNQLTAESQNLAFGTQGVSKDEQFNLLLPRDRDTDPPEDGLLLLLPLPLYPGARHPVCQPWSSGPGPLLDSAPASAQ